MIDFNFNKIIYGAIPNFFNLCKSFSFAALATATIETVFFATLKFHKKNFLYYVFFVNIITNLALNITLAYTSTSARNILIGEICVTLVEFLAFMYFLKPKKKNVANLFGMTALANVLSFCVGLIFDSITGVL